MPWDANGKYRRRGRAEREQLAEEKGMNARELLEHRMSRGHELHEQMEREIHGHPPMEVDRDEITGIPGMDLQDYDDNLIVKDPRTPTRIYCSEGIPIRWDERKFPLGIRIEPGEEWSFHFMNTARNGGYWSAVKIMREVKLNFVGKGITVADASANAKGRIKITGIDGDGNVHEIDPFVGVDRVEEGIFPPNKLEQARGRLSREECREDGAPVSKLDDVPEHTFSRTPTVYC